MALHNNNVAGRFAGTLAVGAACAVALLVGTPDTSGASHRVQLAASETTDEPGVHRGEQDATSTSPTPFERTAEVRRGSANAPEHVMQANANRSEPPARQADSASAPRSDPGGQQRSQSRSSWASPADGTISSRFGTRWGSFHKGVDIANDVGTPIHAGSSGTVISSGPASGYGLWVRVEHPDNTISIYGHIDSSNVEVGQQVGAGEQIARMGNRGNTTGPHLHYQIEVGGNPVDPERFYADRGVRLLP